MTEMKYIGSSGKEYNLNCNSIMISETTFHKHSWKVETSKGRKNKLYNKFKSEPATYEIIIIVRGTLEERTKFVNDFVNDADADVINNNFGTIWVNDMYAKGFFTDVESYAKDEKGCWVELKLSFYCPESVWTKEKHFQFKKQESKAEQEVFPVIEGENYEGEPLAPGVMLKDFKFDMMRPSNRKVTYPEHDFPFDFCKKDGTARLDNSDAFTDTNFILTIYGFADNPSILINNHQYIVHCMIYDGERIEINSKDNSVIKIGRMGEITNLYNSRGKKRSVFQKIQAGVSTIKWSGGFGFDLKLFIERSEPEWAL